MGVYICNTKQDDVKKALENLKESNNLSSLQNVGEDKPQIFQVGVKKYANLKKASTADTRQEIERKKITHILNTRTMTIHKKKCRYIGKNTLRGYLVNVKAAGLRLCKHCM